MRAVISSVFVSLKGEQKCVNCTYGNGCTVMAIHIIEAV